MASITVAGPAGILYVDDGGSGGTPVVFMHSFAGDTSHWSLQLDLWIVLKTVLVVLDGRNAY